jgi:hypothetical protein
MSMVLMSKMADIPILRKQHVRNFSLTGMERQSPSQNGKRPLDGCDTDA